MSAEIKLYVGKELKSKWIAYCEERNLKIGTLLKKTIEDLLQKENENLVMTKKHETDFCQGKKYELKIGGNEEIKSFKVMDEETFQAVAELCKWSPKNIALVRELLVNQKSLSEAVEMYPMSTQQASVLRSRFIKRISEEPKIRKEIRFTQSEHDAITKIIEDENSSFQNYIINCVRASLTWEPQFTAEAIKSLWESSLQLRSIGRNLNQIAKKLNENILIDIHQDLNPKKINYIEKLIDIHTKKTSKLITASLDRWIIERREK